MRLAIIKGNIGQDLEVKETQSGKKYCNFSVATRGKDNNSTEWFNCIAWEHNAEFVNKYFHKGDQILLYGELANTEYETNNGTKVKSVNIIVKNCEFCGKKSDNEASDPNIGFMTIPDSEEDELPFS